MNDKHLKSIIKFQRFIKSKKEIDSDYIKNVIDFPYKIDKFQYDAIKSIEKGQHVLVTAHTSAGKSTIAEYSIAKCASLNQKVIYTSPIKTLSNQKYYDLKRKCSTILKMDSNDIGIMTGDVKINPETSQCIIMTTEILRNKLYKDLKYFEDVGIVIFDEVHYIKDIDRGHVWEESIIMLPSHITIVMLSATISNPEEFANWVQNIKGKKTNLVTTLYRPVPLNFYMFAKTNHSDDQIFSLVTSDKKIDYKNYELVKDHYYKYFKEKYSYKALFNFISEYIHTNRMTPAILFTFSRKNCEVYSKYITTSLIDHSERSEIEKIFNYYTSRNMSENDRYLPQTILIKDNLMKGIGIHHSGLLPLLKEIVEIIFGKGLIKLLFATETFAVGVNMPAKTVIFTELEKFDNYHGKRNLFTDEFLQMSGRAGRRGLDTKGYVIYLPIRPMLEKNELNSIILGNTPRIISKFILDHQLILKSIESENQDTFMIINNSLLNSENNKIINLNNKEIEDLNEKVKTYTIDLNNEEQEIINEYLDELNNTKRVKKKKQKLEMIKNRWKSKSKNFEKILDQLKDKNNLIERINYLSEQNDYIDNSACHEVLKTVNYLYDLNYINYDQDLNINFKNCKFLIKTLNKNNLTYLGIISCQINECNGLLLSQMIKQDIFKSCSEIDIVCILSLFIQDGNKNDEEYLSDKIISLELKKKIKSLNEINNNLCKVSKKYDVYYDFEFNYSFIDYIYLWSSGKDLREIYQKIEEIYENNIDKIYEGNFIKNVIKISNIVREIIDSFTIMNNFEMVEKFSKIDKLLMRGIISSTSIYLT